MARTHDAAVRVFHHFLVVCDPSGHAADGKHDGEHVGWDADGAHDDAAVEIDIRVEFARDEVFVVERDFLEFFGDFEEWIRLVKLGEHLVALLLDDDSARVEALVDAVAEAHEAAVADLVFHLGEELRAVVAFVVDFFEHFEHRLVGAAVEWTPKRADAGGCRSEKVGAAGGDRADRRGRAVLFVVGVKQEDQVERLDDFRIEFAVLTGLREHHVNEVCGVIEGCARIDRRKVVCLAVGEGGDGADL